MAVNSERNGFACPVYVPGLLLHLFEPDEQINISEKPRQRRLQPQIDVTIICHRLNLLVQAPRFKSMLRVLDFCIMRPDVEAGVKLFQCGLGCMLVTHSETMIRNTILFSPSFGYSATCHMAQDGHDGATPVAATFVQHAY